MHATRILIRLYEDLVTKQAEFGYKRGAGGKWTPVYWLLLAFAPLQATGQSASHELTAIEWKLTSFRTFFAAVWQDFFLNNQPRLYASPKITGYTQSAPSGCGMQGPGNAAYCSADNTIYYERPFLVGEVKAAASALKTDGDYAAIVILAHEWGHAAAFWDGQRDRKSMPTIAREQLANCLAGAVTQQAAKAGKLARGDVEEAEFSLCRAAAAPPAKLTGAPALTETHGLPEERIRAFRKGYNGSTSACLADLKLFVY